MSHEISVNRVGATEAVFGFGEVPWWNSSTLQATVLDRAVSFEEIFSIAFPWTAEMEQLQYADGSLSNQHGIRRSDTLAELGVHSGRYGNIQPRDLFDFCSAFFEESQVPIASAISMRGGKVLNISARLGEINILNSGDIHKSYLCFVNSYDGSMKAEVYKSYIQPVCMNTTVMGLQSADFKMTYKHTRRVRDRIANDVLYTKQLMVAQAVTDAKVKEVLEKLAQVKPTKQSYEVILDELFGESDSTRTKNTKAQFTSIVAQGVNATEYPDFKGTGYGIYTALTDYVDHYQVVRQTDNNADKDVSQVRFERGTIGEGAKLKQKGLEILEKVLVLADGTEEPKRVYDMQYGNDAKTVWPDVTPLSAYPPVEITQGLGHDEPMGESLEIGMDVDEGFSVLNAVQGSSDNSDDGNSTQAEVASGEMLTLYTTAESQFDLERVVNGPIVERVSDKVAMREVSCPRGLVEAQRDIYAKWGYACFTAEQWEAIKATR